MKKLMFLFLFLTITPTLFCSDIYSTCKEDTSSQQSPGTLRFKYPKPYDSFYSNSIGDIIIRYDMDLVLGVISADYIALLKHPDGSIVEANGPQGSFVVHKVGTYWIKARCDIFADIFGGGGYSKETDWIILYCYDNLSPNPPAGIQAVISTGNHPVIKWNANIERDRHNYDVQKMNYFTGIYETIATTTATSYEDFSETMITGPSVVNEGIIRYNVICNDMNSNHSLPSNDVNVRIKLPDIFKNGQSAENPEITSYGLSPNYPNPFNPTTKIGYQIKSRGMTVLSIFDILGNEVAKLVNEVKEPGQYSAEFDASKLPSGTYIYMLKVNDFTQSHKMTLIK